MADTPLVRPAVQSLVPYEPGKPVEEVQRELGLERVVKLASNEGPVRPVPGSARGDRAGCAGAEPLPGRRRLPSPHGARRAPRSRPGERDDRCGRRLGDHVPLDRRTRPRRRDRLRLAFLPELRPRRPQARRGRETGPAHGPPLRRRRDPRRDRPTHEDRLPLQPEQPDRHDDRPERDRVLLRASAGARAHRPRRGVLRVRRRRRTIRTGSRSRSRPAGAPSSCARSRRSTGSPGFASATASARPKSSRRSARCGTRSTSTRPPRTRRARA